jgi:hypothetical protein
MNKVEIPIQRTGFTTPPAEYAIQQLIHSLSRVNVLETVQWWGIKR